LYDVNKWNPCGYFIWIHSVPSDDIRIASTRMACVYIFVITVKSTFKSAYWYLFSFQKERVVLKRHIFVLIGICESKYTSFSEIRLLSKIRGLMWNNWVFPKSNGISKKEPISKLASYFDISALFRDNQDILKQWGYFGIFLYRVSHIRCSTARHKRGCAACPQREQSKATLRRLAVVKTR
jgi:hypothetical protein